MHASLLMPSYSPFRFRVDELPQGVRRRGSGTADHSRSAHIGLRPALVQATMQGLGTTAVSLLSLGFPGETSHLAKWHCPASCEAALAPGIRPSFLFLFFIFTCFFGKGNGGCSSGGPWARAFSKPVSLLARP
jgi:hypothetical protein